MAGIAKAEQLEARKSSTVGLDTQRKVLMDVTNFEQNAKPSHHSNSTLQIPPATKEYIDQLQKENLELKKLRSDHIKFIELTGVEVRKLRENMQKVNQQNWQLSQANSRLSAELTNGKDRLIAMKHELGCLKCVLAVKNAQLQDKIKMKDDQQQTNDATKEKQEEAEAKEEGVAHSTEAAKRAVKQNTNNRRRQSRASSTSAVATKDAIDKEKCDTKRSRKRRLSTTRLDKSEEPESTEDDDDLFEIDEAKFPMGCQHSGGDTELDETSPGNNQNDTEKEEDDECVAGSLPVAMRRSSIGRPLRRAAVKVNTYKEAPLNVKMRRTS